MTASSEAVKPRIPLLLLILIVVITASGSQVKEEGLVLPLLPFLLLSLRLSLVIQQQIWIVMTSAVCHHHRADGAGVDVLDLEKAFDHVDVLGLNILSNKENIHKIYFFLCIWKQFRMHSVPPGRLY